MNSIVVCQAWKAKFRRRWSKQEFNRRRKTKKSDWSSVPPYPGENEEGINLNSENGVIGSVKHNQCRARSSKDVYLK